MKKGCIGFLFVLLLGVQLFAQNFPNPFRYTEENRMFGGIGMTWIDGQPYTTFTLAPEIAIGKFGAGLYLQFLMDNENNFKLRTDEFKDGVGWLRVFRYVRYGQKYDPFFVRLGMLDLESLGNGFLMWNYTNASNYDKRKIGMILDADLGRFGFESMANSLERLELVGGNLYFRPFRFINPNMVILKNFRVYGTYIMDQRFPSWEVPGETKVLSAFGLGADVILINTPIFKTGLYYDYGKFTDFGHGQAVGANAIFPDFIGVFGLSMKFEKRWLGEQFIANFFGPLYELDRELSPFDYPERSLIYQLQNAPRTEGYFGELAGHIIHRVRLIGSYQRLNGIRGSGILHLEALAPDLFPNMKIKATYDKTGIETFEDFRTLDNRSLVTVLMGYQLNPFLMATVVYRWYWVKEVDEQGLVSYRPVERIEPGIGFSVHF